MTLATSSGKDSADPYHIEVNVRRHAGVEARIGLETRPMTPWLVHELRHVLRVRNPGTTSTVLRESPDGGDQPLIISRILRARRSISNGLASTCIPFSS